MDSHQLINQTSGEQEYYTPKEIVEAARTAMGGIDLDPASSYTANKTVKALKFYSAEENGLLLPWEGNIWLNHPFGRRENPEWISKLITEWRSARILQACCITFASTSEQWFAPAVYRNPLHSVG